MEIFIDNTRYLINFMHYGLEYLPRLRGTSCSISKGPKGNEGPELIVKASLHVNDVFNKVDGRKYSLQKALKVLGMPKHERTILWNIYFSIVKKPKVANGVITRSKLHSDRVSIRGPLGTDSIRIELGRAGFRPGDKVIITRV